VASTRLVLRDGAIKLLTEDGVLFDLPVNRKGELPLGGNTDAQLRVLRPLRDTGRVEQQ
jgi:hypothetical protein